MRRVREILRLKHEGGATDRAIARSLSIARSTVALTLERVAVAGLRWPLPATLTDRVLEAMLYAGHGSQQGARRKTEPDWAYVHHELRRPGVTLMLLWEEYRQREPGGYAYSRWCELYRACSALITSCRYPFRSGYKRHTGLLLLFEVGAKPPHDGMRRDGEVQSVGRPCHWSAAGSADLTNSPHPSPREDIFLPKQNPLPPCRQFFRRRFSQP
jgi:hypothetical protein